MEEEAPAADTLSPSSSTTATGAGNTTAAASPAPSQDYASWTWRQKIDDILRCDPNLNTLPEHPESASRVLQNRKEMFARFMRTVSPKLWPAFDKDSVRSFYQVCYGWSGLMGQRALLYPEVLAGMAASNALRCAKVALEGTSPILGRHADPNRRHRFGFSPLHLAAENFNPAMVQLLLRHGASANLRTEGEDVVEGLLPLHVAVENAAMHKYLEDNWEDGDHVVKLILLLSLPQMKMFLDTTRLIAKHTDNILHEVLTYINQEQVVQLAILLLAAQKQLRGLFNKGRGKVSLNGFDMVTSDIIEVLNTLHLMELAMVEEGKNGIALKKLKDRKRALLTAQALVCIVHKAGEDLEKYIQTHSEVPVTHEEILEHVSSILNSNGVAHFGKGIDTGSLKCYRYYGEYNDESDAQRVDKASARKYEYIKKILAKGRHKGVTLKEVRNMFFPYWKSVLSARLRVNIAPPCPLSKKDMRLRSTDPSRKGKQRTDQRFSPNKPLENISAMELARSASSLLCRRTFCAVALMSRKVLKRT